MVLRGQLATPKETTQERLAGINQDDRWDRIRMTTLEDALKEWDRIMVYTRSIIVGKGQGYSANFLALKNDTFGNFRLAKLLGVTQTDSQSVLVRFLDKVQRVCSHDYLARTTTKYVDDKTLDNDIADAINYIIHWGKIYREERDG